VGDDLSTEAMAKIVLMVIVLAVVMNTIVPRIQGLIKESEGGYETSLALADAIECAYRRCVDGCGGTTDNIEIANPDDLENPFNCNDDFCVDYAEDNRVCDENAKANPIVINIQEEKLKLSLTDLFFINSCPGKTCCIVKHDEIDYLSEYATTAEYVLIHDGLVVDSAPKNCKVLEISGAEGTQLVELKPETYYIWSKGYVLNDKNYGSVIIWNDQLSESYEQIYIGTDILEEIDIPADVVTRKSENYKISAKSDGNVLSSIFVKIEDIEDNLVGTCSGLFGQYPIITLSCASKEYSNEDICKNEMLSCGDFQLTLKKTEYSLNKAEVSFEIIYMTKNIRFSPEEVRYRENVKATVYVDESDYGKELQLKTENCDGTQLDYCDVWKIGLPDPPQCDLEFNADITEDTMLYLCDGNIATGHKGLLKVVDVPVITTTLDSCNDYVESGDCGVDIECNWCGSEWDYCVLSPCEYCTSSECD